MNFRPTIALTLFLATLAGASCSSPAKKARKAEPIVRDIPAILRGTIGTESTIQRLLDAGAHIDAKDMHGDSPLSWGSWYERPDSILRLLCYGDFDIRPKRKSTAAYVLGEP